MPVPLLVCSHTVRGTCTIGWTGAQTSSPETTTLPVGVYWNDPIYGTSKTLAYSLQGKVAALMDVEEGGSIWTITPNPPPFIGFWDEAAGFGGGTITPATCNAEGKRVLQRLGLSPSTSTLVNGTYDTGFYHGIWSPYDGTNSRKERNTSFPDVPRERGGALIGFNRRSWPATIGTGSGSRVIVLDTVWRDLVRDEVGRVNRGTDSDSDHTLFTLFWKWASRGEFVRVYSDKDATKTYVTAAVTAAATSISVASGTGIANDDVIWLDGERMLVTSGGGTTTLTVERPAAVAHPAGAPVSKAPVATYTLATDGGNVNLTMFEPERRRTSSPFYNVAIALVGATWEG